jgi:D,D-heptose 1,7-bisphosphate phosphatase
MSASPKPGIYVPGGPRPTTAVMARKALFLDRDGVINVNHGYVHTIEQTDWVPGIFELCATARDAGYALVVVTNQAGIARGYYSEAEFLDYTRWMHGKFAERGLEILATLYCPHHPTAGSDNLRVECGCRKPAPGLFLAAIEFLGVAPGESVMVGDKESDLLAATRAGIRDGFQIDSGKLEPFVEVIRYLGTRGS